VEIRRRCQNNFSIEDFIPREEAEPATAGGSCFWREPEGRADREVASATNGREYALMGLLYFDRIGGISRIAGKMCGRRVLGCA